jgi:hypothetical protein
MHHTLSAAIGELRCVSPDSSASISELIALAAARDSINELIQACVDELRADQQNPATWADIAYALGTTSSDVARQRHASKVSPASAAEEGQILAFWDAFAHRFRWDFLPMDFLYALYESWMKSGSSPEFSDRVLTRETFVRRVKGPATATGEWSHRRSRPGSLIVIPSRCHIDPWVEPGRFKRRRTWFPPRCVGGHPAPAVLTALPDTTHQEETR